MTYRSFARRAGFVAAAPLAGLLAISAHSLDDQRARLQTARIAQAAASLLPDICVYLHALQSERGASIIEPGAGRPPRHAAQLDARRAETDAAADAMMAAIARLSSTLNVADAPGSRATLRAAQGASAERAQLRRLVDDGAAPDDVTIAYSANLERLLAGIARMRDDAPDLKIANDMLALLAQLRISELSGQQRKAGAAALTRGMFAPDRFLAFSGVTMRESAMLDGLALWVSPDILVAIDEALATPEAREFVSNRTALLAAQGAIPKPFVDARAWIALASARIRALSAAENHTTARIADALGAARDAAQARMRGGLAMTATLGVSLAMAVLMASGNAGRSLFASLGLDGRPEAAGSSMMIISADGAVIFITPGLDAALLRSRAYFSARNPDTEFDTIKGKSVDLFDTIPGGLQSLLSGSKDGAVNEVRFDDRRFALVSSSVTGTSGRAGHVVEWTEKTPAPQTQNAFAFAAPAAQPRSA